MNPQEFPHAFDPLTVAQTLGVDATLGLSATEASDRLTLYGKNTLQSIRQRSAWRIFVEQFFSIIIALLAAAAIIAVVTGDMVEAVSIIVVLILNALVGFFTEWQAGRALDALHRQTHTTARVCRDGQEREISAEDLLPGDVVILNAGERVPADGRILTAANLFVEESALTGESTTVEKSTQAVAVDAPLAERHCMLYLGTTIATGRGVLLVTATGVNTELGRIGRLVADAPNEATPLEQKLNKLGRSLVYIVLVVAAVIFFAGWLHGESWWMMMEVAISLAVAAVPEAMPAVTTLILALGVLRMAREQAIVRRLPAVETLGSTTVICTDKTGTLTENRMTVREYFLANGKKIRLDDAQAFADAQANDAEKVPPANHLQACEAANFGDAVLLRALRVSALCNEASFVQEASGQLQTIGDPTETALLLAAHKLGMNLQSERREFVKMVEIPFDATSKRMITIHKNSFGESFAAMKGAPATVLQACANYAKDAAEIVPIDEATRKFFLQANEKMADEALRVLALAEKRFDNKEAIDAIVGSAVAQNQTDFTFLGFVGMIDPPRAEVPEAIRKAQAAGIRIVMMTGDQLNTAQAIARELHLSGDEELHALHARDLAGADHKSIARLARTVNVFARVSPEDKLRIVDALKRVGEIVAVTGDGVNDAPALKRADIGIVMGLRGTDVAKEAADIVLADDNFATIIKAIEGGRTVYANIIKFVHLMFSKNFGAVIVIFTAIIAGLPLPLLPLQILWMNLVTDAIPAFALAVEPASKGVMQKQPLALQTLLSRPFLILIGWQGFVLAAISLAAYIWALQVYGEGSHAQTIALFSLVSVQLGHMFNCRSRTHSAFTDLFINPFLWLAAIFVVLLQLAAVYIKPLARVLALTQPNAADWLVFGASFILPIVIVELAKLFARSRK
jgi:Ca2+-transporting ATPase